MSGPGGYPGAQAPPYPYQQQQQQPGARPPGPPQPGFQPQQPGFRPAGPPPGGPPGAPRPAGYGPPGTGPANGFPGAPPAAKPAQPMGAPMPGGMMPGGPGFPGAPQPGGMAPQQPAGAPGMRPPGMPQMPGAPQPAPRPGFGPPQPQQPAYGAPQTQQPGMMPRPAGPPGPAGMQPPAARPGFAPGQPGGMPGGPRPAGPPGVPGMRPGGPGGMPGGMPAGPPGMARPAGAFSPQQQQQAAPQAQQMAPPGAPGMGGMRPPGPPGMQPGMQPPPPPPQQQGAAGPGYGAPPGPPGMLQPGLRSPGPPGPPMMQPQQPGMGAPPGAGGMGGMRPPGVPGLGAPQPPGMGMGMPGAGYDQGGMQAALDQFETLSLGPSAPVMPGQPADGGANPAMFPRPAGPGGEAHVGPPPPYSPYNCKPEFVRMTSYAVPNSQALKARWHLPFGSVVHPMAEDGGPVAVANPNGGSIIRCKRCRTYMNPFMSWLDGGRRFACNVCAMVNEVPVEYFCTLDTAGRRIDHADRPELCSGSVEYVAPAEYMVRAPMPPTYVFVIDVSFAAASSGMLPAVCATIRESLDALPGDERTQVAFITFDRTLHFYNLKSSLSSPQQMVVAEVDDPFVPLPDDLLVNLHESRPLVDALLDSLPQSYGRAACVESAMGPALQAAFLVMNHIGGKLLLFQASAPSLGIGRIKARDNPALYGTEREYSLRTPDDPFYKRFSAEASRFQICVDVFACGSTYMDLPSLGALPKYTGGQLYYYPGFAADRDGPKLAAELRRNLARETAWEAVMRIRCSKGLRIAAFFGHFFIRSTDLLALPACDADKSFSVEISHEETLLTGQVAYLQAALLYTNSVGERRIRVHTVALPVVSELIDLYKTADAGATVALLGKHSVERAYTTKLDDVRSAIQQRLVSSLREYRMLHMRGGPAGLSPNALVLPERLKCMPLLTLGLVKTSALRGTGRDVNSDERTAVSSTIMAGSVYDALRLVYPNCYPVHDAVGNWGKPAPGGGGVELSGSVPAGLEYFNPAGAYLVDNGRTLILWLGQALPPAFYAQVFGLQGPPQDGTALNLEPAQPGSELSGRINAVLGRLRSARELWQEVWPVLQGTPMEAHLMPFLVEDRLASAGSMGYLDFMMQLQKQLLAKA